MTNEEIIDSARALGIDVDSCQAVAREPILALFLLGRAYQLRSDAQSCFDLIKKGDVRLRELMETFAIAANEIDNIVNSYMSDQL